MGKKKDFKWCKEDVRNEDIISNRLKNLSSYSIEYRLHPLLQDHLELRGHLKPFSGRSLNIHSHLQPSSRTFFPTFIDHSSKIIQIFKHFSRPCSLRMIEDSLDLDEGAEEESRSVVKRE